MKKTPPSLASASTRQGPPSYQPKLKQPFVHPIELAFAADPLDTRFVDEDRRLTPLGILVQTFHYLRCHLNDVAPDAVAFLEKPNDP